MARHNEIGVIGEDIASKYLLKNGHRIIERNFRRKYGEIDIISRETDKIHFIEVKTVSYETVDGLKYAISHETWRPEENVHAEKKRRLKNVIQAWILSHKYTGAFQIDIVTVRTVPEGKLAVVNTIENVIFE